MKTDSPQEILAAAERTVRLHRLDRYFTGRLDEKGSASKWQRRFHKDRANQRFIRKANKVGGSFASCAEVWLWLLGKHPWKPIRTPCTIGIAMQDLDHSYADDICYTLRQFQAPGILAKNCSYTREDGYRVAGKRGLVLQNGSRVIFRSSFQQAKAVTGFLVDALVINEPPAKHLWNEILRSAAQHNAPVIMNFTAAPDIRNPLRQNLRWLKEIIEGHMWSEHEVRLNHENCPYRSPENIQNQIDNCAAWERAQRIDAQWEGAATDRYLMGFTDEVVCDDSAIPDHKVNIGLTLDHGERPGKEAAWIYCYWRDNKPTPISKKINEYQVILLDNYKSPGRTTIRQDAENLAQKLFDLGIPLLAVDRGTGDVNSAGKSSLVSVNKEFEIAFAKMIGSPHPPFSILNAKKKPGSIEYGSRVLNTAFLTGRLRVHERCEDGIYSFRNWKGTKNGTDADFSDLCDCARYGLVDLLDVTDVATTRIRVA